ncbi:MAG TPA: phage baseplate assembly protein V [Nitrosomonas sp.]|nr:phage baseplate assembly protein V [Nitrosomonas sp.]
MNGAIPGVYIGIVKSNKLDAEGRIEITLEGVSGNAKSYPARIATLMAGNGYGTLLLPEKDDQVLVAFINGAISEPVVIGGLWSVQDKSPETNASGENNIKLIRTRSGNEIRIIDEGGKELIEIQSPNGKIMIKGSEITLDGSVHITGTLDVGPELGSQTHIDGNEITGRSS